MAEGKGSYFHLHHTMATKMFGGSTVGAMSFKKRVLGLQNTKLTPISSKSFVENESNGYEGFIQNTTFQDTVALTYL